MAKYYSMEQEPYEPGGDFIVEVREFDSKAERGRFLRRVNIRKRREGSILPARKAAAYVPLMKAAIAHASFPVRLLDIGHDDWIPLDI